MASQVGKVLQFCVSIIVPDDTEEEVFQIRLEDFLKEILGPSNVTVIRSIFSAHTQDEVKEMH